MTLASIIAADVAGTGVFFNADDFAEAVLVLHPDHSTTTIAQALWTDTDGSDDQRDGDHSRERIARLHIRATDQPADPERCLYARAADPTVWFGVRSSVRDALVMTLRLYHVAPYDLHARGDHLRISP